MMLLKDTEQLNDLRDFLTNWYSDYDDSYGVPVEEIPIYLPKALRELYAFAGRWRDGSDGHLENSPEIFQHQDCLLSVEQLRRDGDRIIFLDENQSCWDCQVEANNDNSPVYCNQCMLWDDNAKGYIIINNSLYHFLKSFCLQEVVFGCKNLYAIGEEIDNIQELFDRPIEKVWVNGYYINPKEDGPTHSFYCCENVLVMITHGEYWLGYNCERPTVLNYNVFSSLKSTKII
jgi:hypothetical protein